MPLPLTEAAPTMRRVLVVGGAGVFGARLVAGLIDATAFDVIVAGRHEGRLSALVGRLAAPARLTALVMDAAHRSDL